MASIFIPCPKCYVISRNGAWNRNSSSRRSPLALFCKPGSSLDDRSARFPSCEDSSYGNFPILKAHFNEVAVESSSNSSPLVSTKPETSITKSKDAAVKEESSGQVAVPDTIISAFMDEVSNLVKLVDSKDIAELHLKKEGCELLIRKKEALPQPPVATSLMMQYPQAQVPPQPLVLSVSPPAQTNPVAAAPALPLALPPPSNVGKKSSAPPLQCPMAGTFYRSPAPGEPPFVKVGDKVQKGQVVCIIEAMKLMNEIEADQSGTIVEIIAEDGKPVSLDTPLLIIQP